MKNKRYAIENTSGQWWTGEMWGVKQGAQDYAADELPMTLDDNARWLWLNIWANSPEEWIYIDQNNKGIASVRPIGPR